MPLRQRRSPGAVLRIDLGQWHTYAWMVGSLDMVFPDARTIAPLPPADAVARPALFRVAVTRDAYSTGRWVRVGTVPVPPDIARAIPRFLQDAITGRLTISDDGGTTRRPASLIECEPLERMASWSPIHVESRLRDHYAGLPNRFVDSLRARP